MDGAEEEGNGTWGARGVEEGEKGGGAGATERVRGVIRVGPIRLNRWDGLGMGSWGKSQSAGWVKSGGAEVSCNGGMDCIGIGARGRVQGVVV